MTLTWRRALLAAAVIAVALNLRAAIAAVSPVLGDIQDDLDMSAALAGSLTTLPVLCFAATAPLAAYLGRRLGTTHAVLLGLAGVALGSALRGVGGVAGLLVGTLLVGIAMTIGNVLLPVIVKRDFPRHVGTMTGAFTAALAGGAGIAAAATAPLSVDAGWRFGLMFWLVPALAAGGLWWTATRSSHPLDVPLTSGSDITEGTLRRSRVAWAVTAYFGAQAALYYAVTAWLPTMLRDTADLSVESAGLAMSLFQFVGIAAAIAVPPVAARSAAQTKAAIVVSLLWLPPLVGLMVVPAGWPVWSAIAGFAQGAGVSLAFVLIAMRASTAATARSLSGMAQGFGYVIGASGPFLIGVIVDVWDSWLAALSLLVGFALIMAISSLDAGRAVHVGQSHLS